MTIRDIWLRSVYAVGIVLILYLLLVCYVAPSWSVSILNALTPYFGRQGAAFAMMAIAGAFPAVVAVGVFTFVDRYARAQRDGEMETRCRKCRHILRGITEPQCPECGERI